MTRGPPANLPQGNAGRFPLALACVLAAAGLLPPAALLPCPGGLALLLLPQSGVVLAFGVVAAPLAAALAAALRPAAAGAELRRTAVRIAAAAGFLVALSALAWVRPRDPALAPCLVTAALGLGGAWLLLLHLLAAPAAVGLRRRIALVGEVGVLSAMLHAGGGLTAVAAALYPCIAVANGLAFGLHALATATALGAAGFALAVAATPFWREEPAVAALAFAVVVLVPAAFGLGWRRMARGVELAARRGADERGVFAAVAEDVRGSLRAIMRAGAALDPAALAPEAADALARLRLSARAALVQLDGIPAFAAIEAGRFAPETRGFDLYQLVHGGVAAMRPQAADRGVALSVRIDPRLPYELRGWPRELRQMLIALIAGALRHTDRAAIAIDLDLVERAGDSVRFRVAVRDHGPRALRGVLAAPPPPSDGAAHLRAGLAVAERLAALMGGQIEIDSEPKRAIALSVELPFALDRAALALVLDLAQLPVLIVTGDGQLAAELVEALAAWRAEGHWIGAGDAALAYVEALPPGPQRPVLLVDGRGEVVPALSWAHRARRAHAAAAPYLLFIADEARIDSVIGLADGELDAILPAPFSHTVLQSTLHALRLGAADWLPGEAPAQPARPRQPPPLHTLRELPPAPVPAETPPRHEPPPAEPPPPPPSPPPSPSPPLETRLPLSGPLETRPPLRVLVGAGNAANRRIIERILQSAGHLAEPVATGEAVAAALAAGAFDLVLLDLAPADSAAAAIEACRGLRPGIPIVVLAPGGDDSALAALEEAGATLVLAKPVEPSRLTAAVARARAAAPAEPPAVVTEISSHPRFARGGPAAEDERDADARLSLGAGRASFDDVVTAFRADARRLLKELGGSAAIGDRDGFVAAVEALRNCTAGFGGAPLRDLLLTMQEIGAAELRLKGPGLVQQLAGALGKLEAMLAEFQRSAR
jgi:DNA-binding response OmpR family regulator/signal transduction histidine kinase